MKHPAEVNVLGNLLTDTAYNAGVTREKLEFVYDYMGRMFERVVYKNDIAESTERFMGKK